MLAELNTINVQKVSDTQAALLYPGLFTIR